MSDLSQQEGPVSSQNRWVDAAGQSLWIRALFMILFGVIAYVVLWLLIILAVLQLIVYLVTRSANDDLRLICRELTGYLSSVLSYLTFVRDDKPFPFSPFPRSGES